MSERKCWCGLRRSYSHVSFLSHLALSAYSPLSPCALLAKAKRTLLLSALRTRRWTVGVAFSIRFNLSTIYLTLTSCSPHCFKTPEEFLAAFYVWNDRERKEKDKMLQCRGHQSQTSLDCIAPYYPKTRTLRTPSQRRRSSQRRRQVPEVPKKSQYIANKILQSPHLVQTAQDRPFRVLTCTSLTHAPFI